MIFIFALERVEKFYSKYQLGLISNFMFQITQEVAKLPQSRFLPRPPGHDLPLRIDVPKFQPRDSTEWLHQHGLKGNWYFHLCRVEEFKVQHQLQVYRFNLNFCCKYLGIFIEIFYSKICNVRNYYYCCNNYHYDILANNTPISTSIPQMKF